MMEHVLLSVRDTMAELLLRVLPVTFVALFGTELLVQLGLMRRLECLGRPLTRVSRLPPVTTLTFITGIGSIVAANSMLAAYRNDGMIDDKELVLSSLLNSIPIYLKELLTYHFPVIFPLLGPWVGMVYFMTFWLSGFIKLLFVVLGGRLMLREGRRPRPEESPGALEPAPDGTSAPRPLVRLITDTFNNQIRLFARIASYYTVVTLIVVLCTELGFFRWMDSLMGPMVCRFGLPASVIAPLSAYVVNPIVGLTSISGLLRSREITEYQAIIALLIGGFLMLPMIYLRSMLPKYVVIFGVKLGALIVGLSFGFTLLARIIMLGVVMAGAFR
ncbi:MAG: hypothetical protein AB9873_18985 [Syntrophobacteraceae bacterium]